MNRKDWKIHASPFFHDVRCPVHKTNMTELTNGWFGNPVWWCKECEMVYELKLYAMKNFDREAVDEQLLEKKEKK